MVYLRFIGFTVLFVGFISTGFTRAQPDTSLKNDMRLPRWVIKGTEGIKGLGISTYSPYDKRGSWKEAYENAIQDLNSNTLTFVYSKRHHTLDKGFSSDDNFGIKTFYDTTNVVKVDSALWRGWAFMLIKGKERVQDSLQKLDIRNQIPSKLLSESKLLDHTPESEWLYAKGSKRYYDFYNLYVGMSEAKQTALRRLAERVKTHVKSATYTLGSQIATESRFTSTIIFKNIQVLHRKVKKDTVSIHIAIHQSDIIPLLNK